MKYKKLNNRINIYCHELDYFIIKYAIITMSTYRKYDKYTMTLFLSKYK